MSGSWAVINGWRREAIEIRNVKDQIMAVAGETIGGKQQARLSRSEPFDDRHRAATFEASPKRPWRVRRGGVGVGLGVSRLSWKREAQRQQQCPPPVSEESEMPDADEAFGEHVQKEPAQKLIERQPHEPLLFLCAESRQRKTTGFVLHAAHIRGEQVGFVLYQHT